MSNIFKLIFEQEERDIKDSTENNLVPKGEIKPKARKANDSVDDQIDSLLLLYESKAIRNKDNEDLVFESLLRKSLKYLLEQDEADAEGGDDSADTSEEPPPEGMTNPDEPSGSADSSVKKAADDDLVPDLDVDAFTKRVARLIINYRNLLRVEEAIINRGKNFLDENYGDAFVTSYINTLRDQFGIELSEFGEEDVSVRDAPYSIGANPAGAGISGGS